MSEEKFKIWKAGKMLDWIENEVTNWASDLVTEHFGCEIEELTREQIDEVIEQWEEITEFDDTLGLGFRNVINTWENEKEEYII